MVRKSSVPRKQTKRRNTPHSGSVKPRRKNYKTKKLISTLKGNFCLGLEAVVLTVVGIAVVIVLLGSFASQFSGPDLLTNLLPFAGSIFALIMATAFLVAQWKKIRPRLYRISPVFPATIIISLALLLYALIPQTFFIHAFSSYRTLVGGKKEAERIVLAHQVYANYRRLDIVSLGIMIDRAKQYSSAIEEAASTYNLDADLMMGLAATESSYYPRKSVDGGHGLFQITIAPKPVTQEVNTLFDNKDRVMTNHRYNAFLAAATLKRYFLEMNKDLYLGLLAYNIGPANGGLRFIMQQYKATDFITIQPYLMQLPRDYPTRVLSYALAFRIHRNEGRLLAYEQGKNALSIQAFGIPGL